MRPEERFQLGYISKARGLDGVMKAFFDVDFPEDYFDLKEVWTAKGEAAQPVRRTVKSLAYEGAGWFALKFKDIDDRNAAEALAGSGLFLPLAMLPKLEQEGQFYYHEIVGFRAVDARLGDVGLVLGVQEMPAQDLLKIDCGGKEVLVPVVEPIVGGLDRAKRELYTQLPDGLLDVYLDPQKVDDEPEDDN